LPSTSNSITGGAATQHFARGGLSAAPFSSSISVSGGGSAHVVARSSAMRRPAEDPVVRQGLGQAASTA